MGWGKCVVRVDSIRYAPSRDHKYQYTDYIPFFLSFSFFIASILFLFFLRGQGSMASTKDEDVPTHDDGVDSSSSGGGGGGGGLAALKQLTEKEDEKKRTKVTVKVMQCIGKILCHERWPLERACATQNAYDDPSLSK